MKKKINDFFLKICVLPIIVGAALVYANMSLKIFNLIGWVLLVFGIFTGFFYARGYIMSNKEKIIKFLIKIKVMKKPTPLSEEEVEKKMKEGGE